MYRGQIEIPQSQFSSFVATVESLQIKGLENEIVSKNLQNSGDSLDLVPCLSEEESGIQMPPPPMCTSLPTFYTPLKTKRDSSSATFPVEDQLLVKTERALDVSELSEETEANDEESTAACSGQGDHFQIVDVSKESVSSGGLPHATENSYDAEFHPGVEYVSHGVPQFAMPYSFEENPNHAREMYLMKPKDEVVEEEMCKSHDEEEADYSIAEGNNPESANEPAERAITCAQCAISFSTSLDLEAHQTLCQVPCHLQENERTLTDENNFCCEKCGASFSESDTLKKHERTHTGKKPYRCAVCGACFSQLGNLKTHNRIHTGEKPYRCAECGVSFSVLGTLKTHKLTHTGEKPFRCAECGATFTRSGSLKSHKRIHTGEKPYRCEVCGVSFRESPSLDKHKRIHTGEKPYHCAVCGASFRRSDHLKSHTLTHSKEKTYHCAECGASFSRSDHLQSHKLTHSKEKPYHCAECGASFKRSDKLKSHKLTHSKEKPYHCAECGDSFSRSDNLKSHKLTHSKEKPYHCAVCGASFIRSDKFKIHKLTHSKDNPCNFSECGISFSESSRL